MVLLFYPSRRNGIILQVGISLLLLAGFALALLKSSQADLRQR